MLHTLSQFLLTCYNCLCIQNKRPNQFKKHFSCKLEEQNKCNTAHRQIRFLFFYIPPWGNKRLVLGNAVWHYCQIGGNIKKKNKEIISQGIGKVGKKGLDPGSGGLISFNCAGKHTVTAIEITRGLWIQASRLVLCETQRALRVLILEGFLMYDLCRCSFEPQLVKYFYFSVWAGKDSLLTNVAKSVV